jgi:hypothetical protein
MLGVTFIAPSVAAVVVVPGSVGSTTAGKPFTVALNAVGGVPPYTFRMAGGSLPVGLEITGSTIAGTTPNSIYGVWDFVLEAKDATGAVGVADCYIRVMPADISLSSTSIPPGSVGATYSATLVANGGVGPRIFKIDSGDLPPGLTLPAGVPGAGGLQTADNNVIKGTPTTQGTYPFVLRISDYFGRSTTYNLSITIGAAGDVPLRLDPASVPSARPNEPYTPITFTGVGGAGGYTLTLTGALPQGMSFVNGVLSGTPAGGTSGSYTFAIELKDKAGASVTAQYQLVVSLIHLLPATLEPGTVGKTYDTVTFSASGGAGDYRFSVKGILPTGMTFSSGTLSGTPASGSAGTYSFSIEVLDGAGALARQDYTWTISPQVGQLLPLSISAPVLNAAVGGTVNFKLWASGGTPPYTFAVTAGALPDGLSLGADGLIAGVPFTLGTFRFTISVQDAAASTPAVANMSIFVNGPLAVTTDSLPVLTQGTPYDARIAVTGGVGPYTWMVSSGTLPPGLQLNWLTGVIGGFFNSSGYYRFTVQVSDATAAVATVVYTLGFDGEPPYITSDTNLPGAGYNRPYKVTLQADSKNFLVWTLVAGDLPQGLTLSPSGELSGSTGALGSHSFTIRVTDPGRRSDTRDFRVTVFPPLTIRTPSPLPDAPTGVVSTTLQAVGGVAPLTWTVSHGSLPPGITLSTSGALTGSTGARGTFYFTITAADASEARSSVPYSMTVGPVLAIASATLPRGLSDIAYSVRLTATGGSLPYRWSATGLPAEFSLDPASGEVSGTPASGGQVQFEATVQDQVGSSAHRAFSFTIDPGPLVLASADLPAAVAGNPYAYKLTARGGAKPYCWNIIGTSVGVVLTADGTIALANPEPRTYTFTVAVFDAGGQFERKGLSLRVVAAPLRLSTTSLPDAIAGVRYQARLESTGGVAPKGWSVTGGSLPAGIALGSDGSLTGVTSASGTYRFSVAVVDAVSQVAETSLTLRVLPAP